MSDLAKLIAEMEAAVKGTTEGPWWTEGESGSVYHHRPGGRPNGEGLFSCHEYYGHRNNNAVPDATFTAFALTHAADILAALHRAEAMERALDTISSISACAATDYPGASQVVEIALATLAPAATKETPHA